MKLIQQPGKEKLLISKQKALSIFVRRFSLKKKNQFFYLQANKDLYNYLFPFIKSASVVNSLRAKPERWLCRNYVNLIFGFSEGI